MIFFMVELLRCLEELPTPCCQTVLGGSYTRVDRPETQETGASEDAPRTAAMKKLHARKHAVLSGRVEVSGFQPVKADR
ncbi:MULTISPECIES: hypothetical protein [Pseudomonas]|uniref:hypothetical protein n=1 Tax=Pseudomonas TaxID=286 RepID=UPI0011CDF2A5|nr:MULTISPECIES: hypothetical protein [Pseudomonas]